VEYIVAMTKSFDPPVFQGRGKVGGDHQFWGTANNYLILIDGVGMVYGP